MKTQEVTFPAKTVSALKAIFQRFLDSDQREHETRYIGGPKVDYASFTTNPIARADHYVSNQLYSTANHLKKSLEKWFKFEIRYLHSADDNYWTVCDHSLSKVLPALAVLAHIHFNTEHLEAVLNLQRQAAEDKTDFNQRIYETLGANIILEQLNHHWDRSGAQSLLKQTAQKLEAELGITINLLSAEEALSQMVLVLEAYAEELEQLRSRASLLARRPVQA